MTDSEIIDRFEELEAGRILGDLDAEECREWEELSRDPRCQSDLSLELTAAALEAELGPDGDELPAGLLEELQAGTDRFVTGDNGTADEKVVRPSFWRKILSDNETAWAIAAVFLILFVAEQVVDDPVEPTEPESVASVADDPSPEEARRALLERADDLVRSSFGGLADYQEMSGDVVWSDKSQEGYLSLANLPANDPGLKQYQLWIVDPDRDDKPVDGGVFDIPESNGPVVIPIRNPLVVNKPEAFVITLEQPGGVVVSKQETVVALAKTSQG